MPMGRRSGSLFNHTYSSQFSICDRTRLRPAVASSLTFSLWVDVRNSLLKRPNQRSFAICNKERFGPACSNIKKKNTVNYDLTIRKQHKTLKFTAVEIILLIRKSSFFAFLALVLKTTGILGCMNIWNSMIDAK